MEKRRAYADEPYWGRPVPGFGSATPRILVVGVAPAAHGANRTGRVFTGDRSGDVLFAALHRAGLASSASSVDAADGLLLNDIRVVAAVRCAPPGNAPTPSERATCAPWLTAEWRLVRSGVRVVVALGGFAWRAVLGMVRDGGGELPSPLPRFGHHAQAQLDSGLTLLGCYHPSQQNTFTGRLTPAMLDEVFATARRVAMCAP
jgi:uracil-DNA glycosylase